MTPRTLQCEEFWALLSNSKHSGVPEDSKSPTLGVLGFTPALGQSGVATPMLGVGVPNGLLNFQNAISGVTTPRLEEFFISLKLY
jgi:hypothetical protein